MSETSPPRSAALLILILGLLTAFGPLSVDMYLPAFPAIATDLQAQATQVQHSLSIYFIGLTVGQAFYGPLSDRWGRKGPLLFGLGLYLLASLGCAFATQIEMLSLLRLLQALGGCAGLVISRAVARDCFPPREMARVLSLLMLVMGLAPILAPMAGSTLVEALPPHLGWRSIFVVLALLSALTTALALLFLPETLPPEERQQPLSWRRIFRTYGQIFRDRRFLGPALSGSLAMASMFAYITASSFVFIDSFHLSPSQYSWLFGLNAVGIIGCSQFNRRLLQNFSGHSVLGPVFFTLLLSGLGLALSGWQLWIFHGFWGVALPLWLLLASMGFVMPNTTAAALADQTGHTGSASSLLGILQYALATLSSLSVGWLSTAWPEPARGMSTVILGCCLLAWSSHRFLSRPATL